MSPADVTAPLRRRGRPGFDQQTVLARAIDLFNRQGYDGTSMGDLAKDLGLSKSALYHHVVSKEALLADALGEALQELEATVLAAGGRNRTDSASDRLRAVVRESVVVLVNHQPAVTLLLRVRGNSELEQDALRRRRRIDDALADLVREAAADGALRDDFPPALMTRLLFGMINSLVEWYQPDRGEDPALIADAVTQIAFGGLAGEGPTRA